MIVQTDTLLYLLTGLKQGLFELSVRSSFRWGGRDIVLLLDSLCRGWPIGPMLFESRPGGRAIVHDGVQRLSALGAVLLGMPSMVTGIPSGMGVLYYDLAEQQVVLQHTPGCLPLAQAMDSSYYRWLAQLPVEGRVPLVKRADAVVHRLRHAVVPVYLVDETPSAELLLRLAAPAHARRSAP